MKLTHPGTIAVGIHSLEIEKRKQILYFTCVTKFLNQMISWLQIKNSVYHLKGMCISSHCLLQRHSLQKQPQRGRHKNLLVDNIDSRERPCKKYGYGYPSNSSHQFCGVTVR